MKDRFLGIVGIGKERKEQQMKGDFFKCGAIGWCMEIFWTGMHAIGKKDWKMTGKSSLWMFPIYGMAACIGPVSRKLGEVPVFVRGSIYMLGIFAAEYSSPFHTRLQTFPPHDKDAVSHFFTAPPPGGSCGAKSSRCHNRCLPASLLPSRCRWTGTPERKPRIPPG